MTSAEPWETWPRKPFIKEIARVIKNNGGVILEIEPSILSIYTLIFYPNRIFKWIIGKYRFRKVYDNIYAFSPFTFEHLLASVRSKLLMMINRKMVKRQLIKNLKKLDINFRDTIFIFHRPEFYFLVGILNEKGDVYDCSDDFCLTSKMGKLKVAGNQERERILSSNCDFVIATSKKLYERNKRYNKNVFLMINGYSSSVFDNYKYYQIENFEKLKRPVVGYIGNIRNWIDFELLDYLISNRPDWSFLFVGTVRDESKKDFSKLEKKYNNIVSIKSVSYNEYPNYMNYFDVGIIPFRTNEFMESVNPNKLAEYLGAGLAVVSTNIGDLKNDFHQYVKVGNDKIDFLHILDLLFENYDRFNIEEKNKIKEFGKNFTWDNNAERLYDYLKIYILNE